jgi:RNA polymerase sigma-70 factor (ECF subfamily)
MTASLHLPIPFPSAGRFAVAEFDEASLPPDLIRAAQSGDESAFHSIIRACKGRLAAMASRYVQSASELDDLCQDIFVHLWRGLHSYRFDAPFPHWVSRVAVNTCLTHLKKRRRRNAVFAPSSEPDSLERIPDPSPDAAAASREAADRLRPALASLRPEDRLVITMLHLEERSVAEIADATGWSTSNVKVRALRARQKLREFLQRHESQR